MQEKNNRKFTTYAVAPIFLFKRVPFCKKTRMPNGSRKTEFLRGGGLEVRFCHFLIIFFDIYDKCIIFVIKNGGK